MKNAFNGTDLGPKENSNQFRRESDERSKENSAESKIMVKLGGKDMIAAHIKNTDH